MNEELEIFAECIASLKEDQFICLICHNVHPLSSKPGELGTSSQLREIISELTSLPPNKLPFEDPRFGLCPFCFLKTKQLSNVKSTLIETKKLYQNLSSEYCLAIVKSKTCIDSQEGGGGGRVGDWREEFNRWNLERLQTFLVGDLEPQSGVRLEEISELPELPELPMPKERTSISPKKRKTIEKRRTELLREEEEEETHEETEPESQLAHLQCSFCNTTFTNAEDFQIHVRFHSEPSGPSTSSSIRTIPSATSTAPLKAVRKKPSPKGKAAFICHICQKAYTRAYSLKIHLATHKPGSDKTHKCSICKMTFATLKELNEHLKTHRHEQKKSLLTCPICKKTLSQKRGFEAHLYGHRVRDFNIEPLNCEMCGKNYCSPTLYLTHLELHKGENKCPDPGCKKAFKSKGGLKVHSKVHKPNSKWLDCDYCPQLFEKREALDEHVKGHSVKKSLLCQTCGKSFQSGILLAAHQRLHKDPTFICQYCDKCFYSSSNLKTHLRLHTGEKPYACDVCQERFAQKASLNSHMRKHSGEMPFTCQYCDHEGFSYKLGLRQHLGQKHPEIYLKTKKYVCDICWKNFNEESERDQHKTLHDKHKCKICNRQFKMMNHLKEHLLRHREIKFRPYSCSVEGCGKSFYRRKTLLDHITKAHPDQDPSKCQSVYIVQIIENE